MFDASTDIDWSRLYTMERFRKESDEDFADRTTLAEMARAFVASFDWCAKVVEVWWGDGVAPKIGCFLVKYQPAEWSKAEPFTWVVVGDLPPAYLSPKYCRNVYQAFNGYCGEMKAWVDAVNAGEPVDDLIPVNVAPTKEHAELLLRRLRLIDEIFLEPNARLLDAPVAADREEPDQTS